MGRTFTGYFKTQNGRVEMIQDGEVVLHGHFEPPESAAAFVATVRRDQQLCDTLLFLYDSSTERNRDSG